ncbi:MAG: photosystem I reaction center subunit IV [Deltaproteobacteria bacterium]|nr:photosystem I reaction center subunit IV [Deltaproteobacteria bacterium]
MWLFFSKIMTGNPLKSIICFTAMIALATSFAMPSYAGGDLMLQPAVKSERATTSLLLDVANAGSRLVSVGERGHIVYSEDHGKSWIQADVPVSVTLTAVYFPNPEKGWAVGHEGVVLHTANGGKNWVKQLDGFQANELDVSLYTGLVKDKETVLEKAPEEMKETIGQELEDLRYQLEDLQFEMEQGAWKPFLDVWFENNQRGFVVGAFGYIFQTTDGGKTWQSIRNRIDNPDTYHLKCIARTDGALIVAGEVGILYRSMDRGQSWQALASPTDKSFFGLTASAHVIAAVSFKGTVYLSKDLGESWQLLKTDIRSTLAEGTVLSDGSIAIVSYGGELLRIQNGDIRISVQNLKCRGLVSVAEAEDGALVAVGMPGVHRTHMK